MIVLVVCLMSVGAAAAVGIGRILPGLSLFGAQRDSQNTQIVNAVTRTEQVVLLSLGIQGISSKNSKTTFYGVDVPGSERASFIEYSFNAKLGINGKNVTISQNGTNEFRLSVPRFDFLGHDDVKFRLVVESGGVVSWVTPRIDTVEMVNAILNDGKKETYLGSNEEVLRSQVRDFYGRIISSIDPSARLTFDFN
ncbi:MAG: hypothetical protein QM711_05080 [Micropruina sp.]|uniref:hypothetical protein n=1 Tax=Micropruina sp. TaxID=2737536 RepID=UPI0039E59DE9